MSDRKALVVEHCEGHVREVILSGPGKGNAMGPDFWKELPEVFAELDADNDVRAIVVRGKDAQFSYGLDLPAMAGQLGPSLAQGRAAERTEFLGWIRKLQNAISSVARCKKPVIAAVHGWCIGGGLDLASACDIRLASKTARFSLREVKVAMVADIGSLQRLPPIIGEGATRELAFTGKDIDADRALRMGLVSDVFEDEAALREAAQDMARSIAENPPLVVQGVKCVMNRARDAAEREGLEYVAAWNAAFLPSSDLEEAMMAFMQRRKPIFKGA